MSKTEKLHFKITLGGTYWHKVPEYSILVDDTEIVRALVKNPSGEVETIEFDLELAETDHMLKIRLENKTNDDTVENADKTAIVKDMLLNIKKITIDEVDLDSILVFKTQFRADDPDRPVLTRCVDLGWNGAWELPFACPFYIWLLETI